MISQGESARLSWSRSDDSLWNATTNVAHASTRISPPWPTISYRVSKGVGRIERVSGGGGGGGGGCWTGYRGLKGREGGRGFERRGMGRGRGLKRREEGMSR